MGTRVTDNLKDSEYQMLYLEVSEPGIEQLKQRGLTTTPQDQALKEADVAILAVPDILIGRIAGEIVPALKSGALVICLDPAAPHGGELPQRDDIAYFVSHPAHPSVFKAESDPEAQKDYFGGVKAKQHIVNALVQGSQADYDRGEDIAKKMFAPIIKSHRVTVGQMALLEPALAETLSATCMVVLKEGLEEVIRLGVPEEAAREFLFGHISTALAIVFGQLDAQLSDGCLKAIERAKKTIFRPDWKKIFDEENVIREIKAITKGNVD